MNIKIPLFGEHSGKMFSTFLKKFFHIYQKGKYILLFDILLFINKQKPLFGEHSKKMFSTFLKKILINCHKGKYILFLTFFYLYINKIHFWRTF